MLNVHVLFVTCTARKDSILTCITNLYTFLLFVLLQSDPQFAYLMIHNSQF